MPSRGWQWRAALSQAGAISNSDKEIRISGLLLAIAHALDRTINEQLNIQNQSLGDLQRSQDTSNDLRFIHR
jgi:hypothetical protein